MTTFNSRTEYKDGAKVVMRIFIEDLDQSYNEKAYIDPISEGFEAANRGAIIPVNADSENSKNILKVYWYRKNGADTKQGFESVYWPAAFGQYTIQWPSEPREIVLASNDGTGAMSSLEANGSIYVQNDSTKIGYNPNEEHALMLQIMELWRGFLTKLQ